MAILVSDVKAAVQAHGYGTDTTAQQLTILQGLLRRLWGERRWRFLRTSSTAALTVGTNTLSIPAAAQQILSVQLPISTTSSIGLDFMDSEALQTLAFTDTTRDQPTAYTQIDDTSLWVYPYADKTYSCVVEYITRPTLPANDAAAITWPEQHIDVLVWGVVYQMALRQRDGAMYQAAKGEYQQALNEMARAYGIAPDADGSVITRWDGWDQVSR